MPIGTSDGEHYESDIHQMLDLPSVFDDSQSQKNLSQGGQKREPLRVTITPNMYAGEDQLDEPKTIHFIRHGATPENADNTIREKDTELTDEGRGQAAEAGRQLKEKGVNAIVSSTLPRAMESAHIIASKLGIIPQFDPRLNTWGMGSLEGQPCSEENLQAIKDHVAKTPDKPLGGEESFNDFKDRSFAGIRDAILNNKDKELGIVTHSKTEGALKSWEATGQDNPEIDPEVVNATPDKPGSIEPFTMQPDATIMQHNESYVPTEWDSFDKAATRVREAVKPKVTGHLNYTANTGKDISNYPGTRHEGMLTRAGEAIATSPFRVLGKPLLSGAQNLIEALKKIADRGHEGPLTDEEIQEVSPKLFDFTSMLPGIVPKPAGAAGIFGGRVALTADFGKLMQAQHMHYNTPAEPYEIFRKTGWYKDPHDEHWKHFIPNQNVDLIDEGFNIKKPKVTTTYVKPGWESIVPSDEPIYSVPSTGKLTLKDVYQNPNLYAAYPQLKDLPVVPEKRSGFYGGLEKKRDTGEPIAIHIASNSKEMILSSFQHELQHAVQAYEGFPSGTTTGGKGNLSYEDYFRTSGEVEARNASYWLRYPEDVKGFTPTETYGKMLETENMTPKNIIVRNNKNVPEPSEPIAIPEFLNKGPSGNPKKDWTGLVPFNKNNIESSIGSKDELKARIKKAREQDLIPKGGPKLSYRTGRNRDQINDEIGNLLDLGFGPETIAKKYGVTEEAIRFRMKNAGMQELWKRSDEDAPDWFKDEMKQ
jgi:2,3-bisphosphoglycerate-dependent phosphoglycerate mutase